MLITIILIALVICGGMLIAFNEYRESFVGTMFVALGAVGLVFAVGFIAGEQIRAENDYQKTMYQKEVLEYRLQNQDENIVGNELLYNDIVEFNNNLRDVKKWSANPWTSWFNNAKIATINYIEIPGLNPIQS